MSSVAVDSYSAHATGLFKKENRYRLYIFAGFVVLSILVYFRFEPHRQPTGGDLSMWDYMSQSIVRGEIPYKDVVNIKTPLGSYLAAGAIWITRPFGVRDIIAIRYIYILLAALTVGMTYLIAEIYLRRRAVALLAGMVMLTYDMFGIWNASGTQVKTATLLFGLLSLYAVSRSQWALAGCWGALSFWCWQPGLLFTGAAGLVACRFLTRPFDRRAFATLFGALLPLGIGVAFFAYHGAYHDFVNWCFKFNLVGNSSVEKKSISHAAWVVQKCYNGEWLWFVLFPLGLLWRLIDLGLTLYRSGLRNFLDGSWRLAPEIAFIVFVLFSSVSLQGGPDMILGLPFVAIYTAYLLGNLTDLLAKPVEKIRGWIKSPTPETYFKYAPIAAIIVCVFLFKVADVLKYHLEFTLQDEEQQWSLIASELSPQETVYAQGSLDLLVLYNRPNASKYIYFDRGKDLYAGFLEAGGFDAIMEDLKRKQPKFVSLAKLRHIKKKGKLLAWMVESYEPYKEVTSINNAISMAAFPCSVYRLKTAP